MPEARRPILGPLTQIQRNRSKSTFASPNRQKILVEPRFGVPVKQSAGPKRAMAPHQQVVPFGITHQCCDPGLVDRDIGRFKAAYDFFGYLARLHLAANTGITAEFPIFGKPCQKQYGDDRAAELEQLRAHDARPLTMSIIAVMGPRS